MSTVVVRWQPRDGYSCNHPQLSKIEVSDFAGLDAEAAGALFDEIMATAEKAK